MTTRTSFLILFLLASLCLSAQVGVSAAAVTIKAENWQQIFKSENNTTNELFLTGYNAGLNYWFRLKKKRVEFFPTLSRSELKTYYDLDGLLFNGERVTYQINFTGFHFDTRIYLFDFASDCDCPVWSKQNDVLKKGFYLLVSPGIDFVESRFETETQTAWLPTVSAGVGLDLGISDFLTVTPFLLGRYTPEVDGSVFFPDSEITNKLDDVWRLVAGLNINLRFESEYRKKRYRR